MLASSQPGNMSLTWVPSEVSKMEEFFFSICVGESQQCLISFRCLNFTSLLLSLGSLLLLRHHRKCWERICFDWYRLKEGKNCEGRLAESMDLSKVLPESGITKNFRYLKWRYWILWVFLGGFPLHKPYIQLNVGEHILFRYLICLVMVGPLKSQCRNPWMWDNFVGNQSSLLMWVSTHAKLTDSSLRVWCVKLIYHHVKRHTSWFSSKIFPTRFPIVADSWASGQMSYTAL